jgi:hypothetical protein
VATGDDPALGTVGSAGERDASAQVAPRRDDEEAADGIGVLVDVGRALFGEVDEEGSRDAPANPSTGTSG